VLKKRRSAAQRVAKKDARDAALKAKKAVAHRTRTRRRPSRGGGAHGSRSPSPPDDLPCCDDELASPAGSSTRQAHTKSPDWELRLSDDEDDDVVASPERRGAETPSNDRSFASISEDDEGDDEGKGEDSAAAEASGKGTLSAEEAAAESAARAAHAAHEENSSSRVNSSAEDEMGEGFGDDSNDFFADSNEIGAAAAEPDEHDDAGSEEERVDASGFSDDEGSDDDDGGVWPQTPPTNAHKAPRPSPVPPPWQASASDEPVESDEEAGRRGLSVAEHRAALGDLEDVSKAAAKKAAALAHITIQWAKVVEEVRKSCAARPRALTATP
jgi:hypothetical protein